MLDGDNSIVSRVSDKSATFIPKQFIPFVFFSFYIFPYILPSWVNTPVSWQLYDNRSIRPSSEPMKIEACTVYSPAIMFQRELSTGLIPPHNRIWAKIYSRRHRHKYEGKAMEESARKDVKKSRRENCIWIKKKYCKSERNKARVYRTYGNYARQTESVNVIVGY